MNSLGILLSNTGTPDAPTPNAVRRFLAQFLADERVIEMPRWIWLPVLYGIILNTRPRSSAKLYEQIWDERGSPLLYNTQDLAEKVETTLQAKLPATKPKVEVGMCYGNPSISAGLKKLHQRGANHYLILPLFPQYSNTTSGTIIASVFDELKSWRATPPMQIVADYHDHPAYISAAAERVKSYWAQSQKAEKLLFSFHRIPLSYVEKGDPYKKQSLRSAKLIAEKLSLQKDEWMLSFQSRFGHEEWLQPYTDETLRNLGKEKLASLNVLSPGFAVDCFETLKEIVDEGCKEFQDEGGGDFGYIPALNATDLLVEALTKIILDKLPQRT